MMLPPFGPKCLTASFVARIVPSTLEHSSIRLPLPVSLPGLTGQSSIPGRWLLDRPVKPGDDSIIGCQTHRKMFLRPHPQRSIELAQRSDDGERRDPAGPGIVRRDVFDRERKVGGIRIDLDGMAV